MEFLIYALIMMLFDLHHRYRIYCTLEQWGLKLDECGFI